MYRHETFQRALYLKKLKKDETNAYGFDYDNITLSPGIDNDVNK